MTPAAFVAEHTERVALPLTPSISAFVARNSHEIWQAAHEAGFAQPFWAFAWPGGQALARYILDHPEVAAGRTVLDIGSGSALAGIAAAQVGARTVLAADTEPLAEVVARLNADASGVAIQTTTRDLLGETPQAELVLIGDLFYEPELQVRVDAFLAAARRRGTPVLFADRTTAKRPECALEALAEHEAPPVPALLDGHIEHAQVWRMA